MSAYDSWILLLLFLAIHGMRVYVWALDWFGYELYDHYLVAILTGSSTIIKFCWKIIIIDTFLFSGLLVSPGTSADKEIIGFPEANIPLTNDRG